LGKREERSSKEGQIAPGDRKSRMRQNKHRPVEVTFGATKRAWVQNRGVKARRVEGKKQQVTSGEKGVERKKLFSGDFYENEKERWEGRRTYRHRKSEGRT